MRREYFLSTFFLGAFLFGIFLPNTTTATTTPTVIINEIDWNGNATSTNDEWLELYNSGNQNIALDNWTLNWNNTSIDLTGITITSTDFILLERTDDNSVPNIPADIIYTGSLRNSGENITLKSGDEIIDQVDFSSGWPTNATTTTLERDCNNLSIWQYSNNASGTPKSINSICNDKASNCTPAQITYSCINDGIAEKSTTYNDDNCTDTLQQINYDLCTCEYDDWIDNECTEEGKLLQTRNNTNNLAYCNDTTQLINTDTCTPEIEKIIQGYSCNRNNTWSCTNDQIVIKDGIIDIPMATSLDFSITKKSNFDILKTKNNVDITIYVFHVTKKIIGIAQNWLFFGVL